MALDNKIIDLIEPSKLVLLGVPFDDYSSYLKGTAEAPPKIREALYSEWTNTFSENGIDVGNNDALIDAGDIEFNDASEKFLQIEEAVSSIMRKDARILSLGGDHSISYPIVKALSSRYSKLNILQFDAHPDLYDEFQGNPYSHACPFARIMENNLAVKLLQVGIRTANDHQRAQAEKFGVEFAGLTESPEEIVSRLQGPLYISLDLDVLDPAFAPGISHPEPGGFSTRQVLDIIHAVQAEVIGADIVEYNPKRDVNNITAMTAAKFLKELAAKVISNF